MLKNRKIILWALITVLAIASIFIYVKNNFSFGFVPLFCCLLLFLLLPLTFKEKKITTKIDPRTKKETKVYLSKNANSRYSVLGGFLILVFGMLALYSIGNYFNPKEEVYSNYQHHALRFDGVKVGNLPFHLAGANDNSFIDSPEICGQIDIVSFDSLGVRLRTRGLMTPLYRKASTKKHKNLNTKLIHFNKGDVVELVGTEKDALGNPLMCRFVLNEVHEREFITPINTTQCVFIANDGQKDTASFNYYLKSGYSLSGMAADIPVKMDLSGIKIVRDSIDLDVKRRDIKKTYSDRGYMLELSPSAKLYSVGVNDGEPHTINKMSSVVDEIFVPLNKSLYIGLGNHTLNSFRFELSPDKNSLFVKYAQPKYQYLSASEDSRSVSVMVTTSIIENDHPEDGESGLIDNLTDNVLLFDLFERYGNTFNIEPFYLNYKIGPTNEKMLFSVSLNDNNTVSRDIPANKVIPSVKSKNGTEWVVQVENFRDTTPFKSSLIAWVMLIIIIISSVSMMSSTTGRLFTSIEYAFHLIIIAFLSVRFFLLWRVTTFPPITSISLFEFSHLREFKWFSTPLICLLIFFVSVAVTKYCLNGSLNYKNGRRKNFYYSNRKICDAIVLIISELLVLFVGKYFDLGGILCLAPFVLYAFAEWYINKVYITAEAGCVRDFNFRELIGECELTIVNAASAALVTLALNWSLLSFAVSLLVIIITVLVRCYRNRIKNLYGNYRKICDAIIIVLSVIAIGIVGKLSGMPLVCVFCPVAAYLCFDLYIYKVYATSYMDDINRNSRKDSIGERAAALGLSIVNMIMTSVVTLLIDGGFGIMFTMFMLFSFWLKLADLYQYTRYGEMHKRWPRIAVIVLFAILVAVIACYKEIFIRLIDCVKGEGNLLIFFFVAWLIVCLIATATLIVLGLHSRKKCVARIAAIASVILLVGFILGGPLVCQKYLAGSHTEYRTRVHMESAGDILKSVDSPEAQNKFLQASLNDWILYEYEEIGKDVDLFGEKGNGYFKLQPQSKLGAMWFAQTTDICLSRFIIAEHGLWLARLLVLAFVFILWLALRLPMVSRWPRIIVCQIALLFAVQSLMILLANTRAFIFFGQDFPIISLTSRLSSIYFFILAALAVCSALIGKKNYNYEFKGDIKNEIFEIETESILKKDCNTMAVNMMLFFVISSLCLYFSRENLNISEISPKDKKESDNKGKGYKKGSYYGDRTYDVDTILTQMNDEIDAYINPVFVEYQKIHGVPELKRNMSDYISEFFEANPGLDSIGSQHTRLMLRNFVSSYSKKNSRNNIIYLRNRRTYDAKWRKHDTLEFVVRNEYYKYELPGKVTRQWQGSILEYPMSEYPDNVYISNGNGYSYAYIPRQYSASGNPIQLLKTNVRSTARVISSDAILKVDRGMDVVEVDPLDFVSKNNRELKDAPLAKRKYIARRLLVNGKRSFVYPYGHKMFWSRNESYRVQRNRMNKEDFGSSDAYFTIDINLCDDIYDAIEADDRGHQNGDDRTVVVADGDGNVKALVDHRFDRRFRLNPNDYKRIVAVSDSLYIFGERGRALETRYFGNFAKDFLRLGPGSSQKPILWSAVTSMYNTGWWSDLKMAGIGKNKNGTQDQYLEQSYITDRGKYVFTKFAGKRIEKKDGFRSIIGDEGKGNDVNLEFYMYKSSNYYNAIIAYLGAFPKSVYEQDGFLDNDYGIERDGLSLFMKRPSLMAPQKGKNLQAEKERYAEDYIGTFPTIYIDSHRNPLVFNRFLDAEFALDETALAPLGLQTNFGLGTYRSNSSDLSRYNIRIRENRTSERQLNEYVVRSVAIGSNTIWLTSPCKMAEMYGRLISMDKSYTLHLDCNESENGYEFFELDESWGNASAASTRYQEYMKARKHLILGMSQVFGSNGTAKDLGLTNLNVEGYTIKIDDGVRDDAETNSLYIYGKTGTINGKWGGSADKEDHLLATIITDKKVSVCTAEELKDMKFYVIYQADYNYSNWKSVDKDVILEVLKSDAFKKYMGL